MIPSKNPVLALGLGALWLTSLGPRAIDSFALYSVFLSNSLSHRIPFPIPDGISARPPRLLQRSDENRTSNYRKFDYLMYYCCPGLIGANKTLALSQRPSEEFMPPKN
ncbi:hypothetical protein BDP81DRAFT_453261 [Colletotrichum phormii]|uniref:Uncharacterized protein n=1 Tax=Colletotrichum phormii TaxID=359342 RepID=A0AAI9ZIL7_9PEZI|nr:uncharacterized protein BDP81DRAFT_453261 [Colletotrichum phormii]KAK1624928.1 hypothetical protein BDP81DRAFT_453261 [Colletotrichum phormii]